jgi:hypothetical protein
MVTGAGVNTSKIIYEQSFHSHYEYWYDMLNCTTSIDAQHIRYVGTPIGEGAKWAAAGRAGVRVRFVLQAMSF